MLLNDVIFEIIKRAGMIFDENKSNQSSISNGHNDDSDFDEHIYDDGWFTIQYILYLIFCYLYTLFLSCISKYRIEK